MEMQNHKDNFIGSDENSLFRLSVFSVLGDREEQQDSVGFELKADEGMVVVCDGMGGHECGKLASTLAVDLMLRTCDADYPCKDVHAMLIDAVVRADARIASMTHKDGTRMTAGSTLVAVHIRGKELYWVSVGDSRIYLYRNGELVQATEDHIYRNLLDEKYREGEIEQEIYDTELERGEALISFLGVDGLPKIDSNDTPLLLQKEDLVLLMTDGLYKLVPDEEIGRILENFVNIDDALKALEMKVQKAAEKQKISRDNMTLALLKLK